MSKSDIIVIGAGPAGASCAALLNNTGYNVTIVEKSVFPRFTLGESFLPQNMAYFEQAGLLKVFEGSEFQYKDGAEFLCGNHMQKIDFSQKSAQGASSTFQVRRDIFDKLVTDEVQKQGVEILFDHEVIKIEFQEGNFPVSVLVKDSNGVQLNLNARFIVDASGFAKVLPKLLNLETTYAKHGRKTYFTHIATHKPSEFDHNKILITVDESNRKNWFWTIPFGDDKYSLGITTEEDTKGLSPKESLEMFIERNKTFKEKTGDYTYTTPVREIHGFSGKTPKKFGDHFVLIGNSGEFLDPVFSSGATIALKSASLAAKVIDRKLKKEVVDWIEDYQEPLDKGLKTFSSFVDGWYSGDLQNVIFSKKMEPNIRSSIISILAGYAWDEDNPFTKHSSRRLKALGEVCGDFSQ